MWPALDGLLKPGYERNSLKRKVAFAMLRGHHCMRHGWLSPEH